MSTRWARTVERKRRSVVRRLPCLQKIALFVSRAALTAGSMAKSYFVQPVAVATSFRIFDPYSPGITC